MEIKKILQKKNINKELKISGWIRFNRTSKKIIFIDLYDGSNLNGIQIICKKNLLSIDDFEILYRAPLYSAFTLKGKLILSKNNNYEFILEKIIDYNFSDPKIPLGKKDHTLEFLRMQAHLRIRTKLFQSVMRIRSYCSQLIHSYFAIHGFYYINTPIITKNDAEGAGETFFVKTKDNNSFFNGQGTLTVSGQLQEEAYTQSLKKTYTFAPTFRAENSNTSRHANEFWMIEPEMAFADYFAAMNLGENILKFISKKILNKYKEELLFLGNFFKLDLIKNLEMIINKKFLRITYQKALEVLKVAKLQNNIFLNDQFNFGDELTTEHEKYLAEKFAKGAIYIYDYPAQNGAFYMYKNNDNKTVRGFDLLVPKIGELIGGSQRENDYQKLIKTIDEKKLALKELTWYLDLRKYGYAKSSGFGIGFERLIMFITGVENIRDVLPFPRTPGKLEF
ncbi:MAG: asparagine--tRNA ligase [Candidatus Hepatoplasma scabrum]|nr:MAG: asparagine--tRNA ligase [Candidatus Hepatoplasma sp.]